MAIVIPGGIFWPRPIPTSNAPVVFNGGPALSAGTHRWTVVLRIPRAGTLTRFGVRLTTAPGTASTLKFSFQNVNSNPGDPDGTIDQYRDGVSTGTTSGAWIMPADPLTDDGTNGGVKRSVSVGDLIACVADITSYGASSFQFGFMANQTPPGTQVSTPYAKYYDGATWGNHYDKYFSPLVALEYDDGSFVHIPGAYPYKATDIRTIGTGTTPDEFGNKITLPFGGVVAGLWWHGWGPWQDSAFVFYDNGGSQAATTGALSLYHFPGGFFGPPGVCGWLPFTSPVTVAAGDVVRVVEKPSHASDGMRLQYFDLDTAAMRGGTEGGTNVAATERTDGGSWTDTTTRLAWIGLWFSEVEAGAGGGEHAAVWA